MQHRFRLTVYYEDTDLAGVVYHANFLKYIERGRTEFIREMGIDQGEMKLSDGLAIVVRRMVSDFHRPARFGDTLWVHTWPVRCTGARIDLGQKVLRDSELLFSSEVTLACIRDSGAPARIPAAIRTGIMPHLDSGAAPSLI